MTSENGKNRRNGAGLNSNLVWVGVGIGAAIGVAVVMKRRKQDPWTVATKRIADKTGDLAAASQDIVERLKIIYVQGCKVVEEASELWAQGRKLVGA
ncbi:MAG: hypothetical protein ACLP59_02225 [Bryobacteraceae bacterium]